VYFSSTWTASCIRVKGRFQVLGKPAIPFFETALAKLSASPDEALMIGDDIQGDIGGAQAAGIRGVLVKPGKFRSEDLSGEIRPDAVLDSFADLLNWRLVSTS